MGETVTLSAESRGISRITIARPERKNAFDASLIAELAAAVGRVDRSARAVVLQSEGDTFCAGADVEWMRGMAAYSLDDNIADSKALAAMFRALYDLEMPLVARVQGAAIGGRAGLVAGADIAGASPDASLAFTETRPGILPAVGSADPVRNNGAARSTALIVTRASIHAHGADES